MVKTGGGWEDRFAQNLERICDDPAIRERILEGADRLGVDPEPSDVIAWTLGAISRLKELLTPEQVCEIMTGCACRYPREKLQRAREAWLRNQSIDEAMEELQRQLELSLREGMLFEDDLVDSLLEQGWGVAGRREGDRIFVTKIPRSGNLRQYMSEEDPRRRRELYCHCPRIRDAVPTGTPVPQEYCLCGAGFYRHIWETILDRPVRVEVLETVCAGGDRCSFCIHLPGAG